MRRARSAAPRRRAPRRAGSRNPASETASRSSRTCRGPSTCGQNMHSTSPRAESVTSSCPLPSTAAGRNGVRLAIGRQLYLQRYGGSARADPRRARPLRRRLRRPRHFHLNRQVRRTLNGTTGDVVTDPSRQRATATMCTTRRGGSRPDRGTPATAASRLMAGASATRPARRTANVTDSGARAAETETLQSSEISSEAARTDTGTGALAAGRHRRGTGAPQRRQLEREPTVAGARDR